MGVFVLICAVAALTTSIVSTELISPCPSVFHYDKTDKVGQWTATLTLLSESELYGVWIRLIFDRKLEELTVADGSFEIISDENQYLIKNKDFFLKSNTPVNIKLNAKYNGKDAPELIAYRLNANMMCSKDRFDDPTLFRGDVKSGSNFLSALLSRDDWTFTKKAHICGKTNDGNNQPWLASVHLTDGKSQTDYICGATVVSPRHVVTAAHCVTATKNLQSISTNLVLIKAGGKLVKSKKISVYPGYKNGHVLNDLAVVELEESVNVMPICLGVPGIKEIGGIVAGNVFGENGQKVGAAKVARIEKNECIKREPKNAALLTDNIYCGKYVEENGICVGDSGSGLASLRGVDSIWELRGIITIGVAAQNKQICDESSTIYLLDVVNYLEWIRIAIS